MVRAAIPAPLRPRRVAVALLAVLALAAPALAGRGIGTDLDSLDLCLYGDCEARGTFVADPFGLTNPGTMPYTVHNHFMDRGVATSGSWFDLSLGEFDGWVGSGVVTASWEPFILQVATAYAEASGGVEALPGVRMSFRTRGVRLAAGIDAERLLGVPGLGVGLAGIVPGTTTEVRLRTRGFKFLDSTEHRDLEIIPGLHWHGGERDWLMFGAMLDVLRNGVDTAGVDLATGTPHVTHATNNAWYARVGTSTLPFVPLGLADDSTRGRWLADVRLAADVAYRNISAPGEGLTSNATAFFGVDAPMVPKPWNPLARWVDFWLLAGVDTRGGWGVGAGFYGQGPLRPLGCNPAWSSRPNTDFIADRLEVFAITCTVFVPL